MRLARAAGLTSELAQYELCAAVDRTRHCTEFRSWSSQ